MSTRPTLKPLDRQAIVITGATSGIGLSIARRAAKAGACVFLIARGEQDLKALVEELQRDGARVAYAAVDVGDHEALAQAAEKCRRLFGGFDTWVNNAGVAIFGTIAETSLEDQRRLFETNYWGTVNGSTIAAEHLKGQPNGGTIVNIASILSDMSAPMIGPYVASKHAVKGFTNAFRIELLRDKAPVNVTLIKASMINTPYSRHARNIVGYAMKNPQPVYGTHVVADAVLWCASHSVREMTVGGMGWLATVAYSAVPSVVEPMMARFAPSLMRDRGSVWQPGEDGLYEASEDGLDEEVHYPWVRRFSALAEVTKRPGVAVGALTAVATAGLLVHLLTRRTGPRRYEVIREAVDPRRWAGVEALRQRFGGVSRDLGERAGGLSDDARRRAHKLLERSRRALSEKQRRRYARDARRQAEQAARYARDHAKEGGALLAVATIAAAIGAAAWEARGSDSRQRRLPKS